MTTSYFVVWNDGVEPHANIVQLEFESASETAPVAAALEDLCGQAVYEDLPEGFDRKDVRVFAVCQLPAPERHAPPLQISLQGFGAEAHVTPGDDGHWELEG